MHGDLDPSNISLREGGKELQAIDYGDSGFGTWVFELVRMYDLYYEPVSGGRSPLLLALKRLFFLYYLWIFLGRGSRGKRRDIPVILHTLGAMVNIERLVAYASPDSDAGDDVIRRCTGRVLDCIESLPDGVFPLK